MRTRSPSRSICIGIISPFSRSTLDDAGKHAGSARDGSEDVSGDAESVAGTDGESEDVAESAPGVDDGSEDGPDDPESVPDVDGESEDVAESVPGVADGS